MNGYGGGVNGIRGTRGSEKWPKLTLRVLLIVFNDRSPCLRTARLIDNLSVIPHTHDGCLIYLPDSRNPLIDTILVGATKDVKYLHTLLFCVPFGQRLRNCVQKLQVLQRIRRYSNQGSASRTRCRRLGAPYRNFRIRKHVWESFGDVSGLLPRWQSFGSFEKFGSFHGMVNTTTPLFIQVPPETRIRAISLDWTPGPRTGGPAVDFLLFS